MEKLKAGQVVGLVDQNGVIPGRVVLYPNDGKFIDNGKYLNTIPPAVQLSLPNFSNALMSGESADSNTEPEADLINIDPKNFLERIRFKMADLIPPRRI